MSDRKLATIRRVAEIREIPGADSIEAVRVDGWWVVAKKGEYQVDKLAVYLEVDSWVPTELAPFLTKPGHTPKEFEGVKGERLRTIRLRGQLSQGLLLPFEMPVIKDWCIAQLFDDSRTMVGTQYEGEDVTDVLGILKWEKPVNANLAGIARGNFPSFIPKTDQERIQNCTREFEQWKADGEAWEVTEKLDGSSMTVYYSQGETPMQDLAGVCSRNLDLEFVDDRAGGNSFWNAAIENDLINKIMSTGRSLAIQGELIGEGIQGNSYKLTGQHFYCFDIFDIDKQEYLLPWQRWIMTDRLGINHVPIVNLEYPIHKEDTIEFLLHSAEGKSSVGAAPQREGLVFKSLNKPNVSFKAISNAWLLKNDKE
jgi:RNA ligase (TIGR02306 family)